jgi:hypothetical protein
VKEGEDHSPIIVLWLTMHTRDRLSREEARHRKPAQRDNDLGIDDLELTIKVGSAGGNLSRRWITILRRPALDHVRDIDLIAPEADTIEKLLEESSGRADEWPALLVLVESRPLADKHDLGIDRSFAWNRPRARPA